ncbi:unnamed protein product [Cuscuta epithymum]|uniref:PWWP domain-containing protein n=1 Tax=Cuscuta epithymum TaxID=186058 RepID=A0AAV0CFY0_9ASTE|nr:unnamed protein product [Cuscuta epithymum]
MLSVMRSKAFDSNRRSDSIRVTDLRAPLPPSSGAGNEAASSISTDSGDHQAYEIVGNDSGMNLDRGVCLSSNNSAEARVRDPHTDSKEGSVLKFMTIKNERRNVNAELKNSGSLVPVNMEYDMMLSKFDDFAASGKPWAVGWGYEMGDMVWGKVKSHPWWPGHIFHEAFATTSVQRSKRDGHILVAFFGDSSYGWFEPSELVPFDSNFRDKSQQTNLRSFTRAVDEAIDELSRRCALGLICSCRPVYNFRPISAEGFFEVDFNENEKNFIYSASQIKKSRESFNPRETLAFTKKMALTPMSGDCGNITYIKNKATALAYRKAVFAPDDPTYAEAFGAHVTKNLQHIQRVTQPSKVPQRASLSGRVVSFDAVGKGKPSAKHNKVIDKTEKDRYLFKRRDEPENVKGRGAGEVQAGGFSTPLPFDVVDIPLSVTHGAAKCTSIEAHTEQPRKQNAAAVEESPRSLQQVENCVGEVQHIPLPAEAKPQSEGSKVSSIGGTEKVKNRKRPVTSETSQLLEEEKKKKKKKKTKIPGMNTSFSEKKVVAGGGEGSVVMNQTLILGGDPNPVSLVDPRREVVTEKGNQQSEQGAVSLEATGIKNGEDLSPLLCELQSLALNPFYHLARGCPATARTAFLRFRSLVYRKSLGNESPDENESNQESHSGRLSAASDGAPAELKTRPPHKPSVTRHDDAMRGERKRAPSDRQEEISIKKKKKMNDLRVLTAERKAGPQRISEVQPKNDGEKVVFKPGGEELSKRRMIEQRPLSAKEVSSEPTMLIMKFPPKGALPSIPELKVKFSRFGALDHSATRVYWKSSTCRLVYRYKKHAEAALRYAESTTHLFGNADVKCSLREADAPPETAAFKTVVVPPPREDNFASAAGGGGSQSNRDSDRLPPHAGGRLTPQQQLKSCLKRLPPSEETGNGGNNRGTIPRVKFDLGGEDSNRAELLIDSSKNTKTTAAPSSDTTTTTTNIKIFSKVILPPSSQLPSPPAIISTTVTTTTQFHNTPTNLHFTEMTPHRNVHNFSAPFAATPTINVDVSQQMLGLLTKCHEVLTNLTNVLGYSPYWPL